MESVLAAVRDALIRCKRPAEAAALPDTFEGFELWSTGGGFFAYVLHIDGGRQLVITDLNGGADAPEPDNWMVGIYRGFMESDEPELFYTDSEDEKKEREA